MKPASLLALACGMAVSAQGFDLGQSARAIANRARAERIPARPPQAKPGEAGLPVFGEAPLPLPSEAAPNQFRLYEARQALRQGDTVEATGAVRFAYRGYEARADYVLGDLRTEEFLLRGNVVVLGEDQKITGEEVFLDFKNERAAFSSGTAVLGPGFIKGNLRSDIFIKSASGAGTSQNVQTGACELTTCDRTDPHFHFSAKSSEVRTGKRVILRDVAVTVLGKRILRLPFVSFPLDDYSERYIPEVGESPDEGYFVKTRWPSELRRGVVLDSRVDYMTRLGGGLGGDLNYALGRAQGLFRVYGITGSVGTFLTSLSHRQNVFGGDLVVDGALQKNNYQTSPGVQTTTLRTSFSPGWTGGTTRLNYNRFSTHASGFASRNESYGLTDSRRFGRATSTNLTANYASNRSGQVERKQVDLSFRGSHEMRWATGSLEYQRAIPVGQVQSFFSAADRAPVLGLASDSRRLFGESFGKRAPFRTQLTWGELKDTLKRRPISRLGFDLDFQPPGRGGGSGFQWDGRFKQALYGDDTAQYVVGSNLGYVQRLGRDTEASLRHTYLRPYGYTPLSIDRSGETNLVGVAASYRPIRSFKVSGETSYDLVQLQRHQPAWQSINLRTEWRPHQRFQLRSQANYDSARERWSNVRWDLGWEIAGGFVSAGARYDAQRHTWGSINALADGLRWGRLRTSILLAYNGYTQQFEARHFSFIYDLHCAEAILQVIDNPVGFRRGTEIGFFIRIKAAPFATPFGSGRRGQAIGTGTGIGF